MPQQQSNTTATDDDDGVDLEEESSPLLLINTDHINSNEPPDKLGYGATTTTTTTTAAVSTVSLITATVDDQDDEQDQDEEAQDNNNTLRNGGGGRVGRWTTWSLNVAYLSIFFMSSAISLEGQVTYSLSAFAVSSFHTHSLLSTVYVVQGVFNAVIKPPVAKIADVFGRLEAFSLSVLLCVLGYLLSSISLNVQTFASAQISYSAGSTGLQILQQIFVADTSSLLNRALLSSIPDSPFLVTVWIGPSIAEGVLRWTGTWRWGYAIWTVILPVAFLPLGLSLHANRGRTIDQKTKSRGARTGNRGRDMKGVAKKGRGVVLRKVLRELDVVGMLLLSSGLALILIPLTLASRVPDGWGDARILGMISTGVVLVGGFLWWEGSPKWAPYPLLPLKLLKERSFVAGCGIGFFYFMIFYLSVQPYFYSYLLVALNLPISVAGPVTQAFSFASTIAALLASLFIRNFITNPRPRPFLFLGVGLYTAAILLLLQTRRKGVGVGVLFAAQIALGAGAGLLHVATQLVVQLSSTTTTTTTTQLLHSSSSSSSSRGHTQSGTGNDNRNETTGNGNGNGSSNKKKDRAGDENKRKGTKGGPGGEYVGVATAAFLTLVEVGGAVGAAISGAVWGGLVPGKLATYLPSHITGDQAKEIYASVVVACSYPWNSPERDAIGRAYQETMTVLLSIALVTCIPLILLTLLVKDYRLDDHRHTGSHPLPEGDGEQDR